MNEKRSLFIITEGKMDAAILHTLLDCKIFEKVYQIPAGGFGNLSSVAKSIRLMNSPMDSFDKILIAFDADSMDTEEKNRKVEMMRNVTSADYDRRIGVFGFIPNIEGYLFPGIQFNKNDKGTLVYILKEHIDELRDKEIIKEMQAFIDRSEASK